MKTLPTMTAFVLFNKAKYEGYSSQNYGTFSYNHVVRLETFAQKISQPLTPNMFIPMDEEGNVLEQPCDIMNTDGCRFCACREYKKALSKVLFEGWHCIGQDEEIIEIELFNESLWLSFYLKGNVLLIDKYGAEYEITTIESLIPYNLPLTENGIKYFGL